MVMIEKTEYETKRNMLIPQAERFADNLLRESKPLKGKQYDKQRDEWNEKWNKIFHSKMNELYIDLKKSTATPEKPIVDKFDEVIMSIRREEAACYERLFHVLLIILSNHRTGVVITEKFVPKILWKFEGGVEVKGRLIMVTYKDGRIQCFDEGDESRRDEAEIVENAAKDLLMTINWRKESENYERESMRLQKEMEHILDEIGTSLEILQPMIENFMNSPFGDPLRSFFNIT